MPVEKVTVKWGRETYPDLECNTDEEPSTFKALLFSLTGVDPSRQKVMIKGKNLGDKDWNNIALKSGMTILLMGTKEEDIAKAAPPVEKVKFVEDMNEAEIASALDLPVGLQNLGNTCYLNATVQCLKTVPPLVESLQGINNESTSGSNLVSTSIATSLRDLYNMMDKGLSFPPLILLNAVHTAFPRFAERSEHGGWVQQDANECWTELIRMLQQKLPSKNNSNFSSLIDQYLGGKLSVEWKCNDPAAAEEPSTFQKEDYLQLSCFITQDVKYMFTGLKEKLEEKITKRSPTLDRDAEYIKSAKIERLPAYLTIQMVRFYFKERQAVNAKIVKDVKFPLEFDAFDLCTKELQEKLNPMRTIIKDMDDAETNKKLTGQDTSKKEMETLPYSFEDDLGSNNSGMYELQAVMTHKGRSSSSGHYVGWIRHKEKRDIWLKCDDDNVSAITTEDILKLSGGGDWHIAYVLLYGPRIVKRPIVKN